VERVFYLYTLAALVGILFVSNEANIRLVGVLFIGCTLPVAVYNFSLNAQMFMRKRTCFRFFSIFEFIALFGAVHDGAIYLMRFMGLPLEGAFWQYMIFPYAIGSLFVGIILVLAVGFIRIAGEKKSLSLSLDTFARENAILTKRLSESRPVRRTDALPVTGRTEERIEQVIRYIRENYRDNLSREGLAAMVDLHPDNLSRFFKQYTRKRIGDYINELRIDDAARTLVEKSDVSIIRIAFDVGFDSLRTFNRAFRKTKGLAPEQYRRTMFAAETCCNRP
jgi:AraC-like DNA-binding protein